jgi:phosphotransferase system enzyme I (PtsI)
MEQQELRIEGVGVSPGIAIGTVWVSDANLIQAPDRAIAADEVESEISRFRDAVETGLRQIAALKRKASQLPGNAAEEAGLLLDVYARMLQGSRLVRGVEKRITDDLHNAEGSVQAEIGAITAEFRAMGDAYLAARGDDIQEVGQRLIRILTRDTGLGIEYAPDGAVILAEEMSPADTALLDPRRIRGFAAVLGGAEGHTAILARSLGLPAVLGAPELLTQGRNGDTVIIDGRRGRVILRPTPDTLKRYEQRRDELARQTRLLERLRDVSAETVDGQHITMMANVELPGEMEGVIASGAEGIGLLRSEFLFMNRDKLPDEDEQYEMLTAIVKKMGGHPVTIRTLDAGGEKLSDALGDAYAPGQNPALGMRAIRLQLSSPELLETQLAAILRAAAHGPVRILLPMVTSAREVRKVREIMKKVVTRLKRRKVKLPTPLPPLGVMIEVPGAALAADSLAGIVDFFAIGSNDLTQYTLAIDRTDEQVAHLYDPCHPAVLRLIQFTTEAALRARIPVSICGELAGDTRFTPLLIGLGLRDLSMSAQSIPRVKHRILNLDLHAATRRAQSIMEQSDQGRIAALLDDFNDALS